MSKNFFSKMLVNVLTISLVFQNTGFIRESKAGNLPSCYMEGNGGRVANVGLSVGDLCSGDGKVLKLVRPCKGSDNRRILDFSRCLKKASKSDLNRLTGHSDPNWVDGSSNSGNDGVSANGNGNGNGTGNTTTTTTTTRNCVITHTCSTDTYTYTHSTSTTDHWEILKYGCPDLAAYVEDKRVDLSDKKSKLKKDEEELKKLKAKLSDCHKDCRNFAVKESASKCYFTKVKRVNDYKKVARYLTQDDFKDPELTGFRDDGQKAGKTLAQSNFKGSDGEICEKLLEDELCAEFLLDDNLNSCFEDEDYIAWKAKAKSVAELKAQIAVLEGEVDKNECVIGRTRLPNPKLYEDKSIACLEMMVSTCDEYFADLDANHSDDCVDCNRSDSANTNTAILNPNASNLCLYGPCPPGVSKAAQIIGAIGSIGVPLGLGAMQMAMYNNGLSKYSNSLAECYKAYDLQVRQAQYVGLPPQGPNCGIGGFGMGGFMGGLGGMMGGLGGLGMGMMNPMMMGGMGMMNPMMGGLGLGLNAGLSLGMNPIMGGMGMMNPMMMGGMGMINPMMGGMGMMNPMMGGMGMMNPMMNVQQQMMESQMRMQEMAAMQMAAQTAYGMGYPNMMSGMSMPYFGMGQNPLMFSPMMNNGLNFNAGFSFGSPFGSPFGMMSPMGAQCGYMYAIPCAY
ncbi:MAG: hypothetical protein KGP28_03765 [Bdellovibrionales bacterium]|nr:hypothetical protein [Bdellovibrionales bacterium]